MAKIDFRLSKKILTDSGRSEIIIQFSHQHFNMRAKSEIFVNPSFFIGNEIIIKQRKDTPDVLYHKEQQKRLNSLKDSIMSQFENADKATITKDWLKDVVDRYNHPEKYQSVIDDIKKKTIYDIINEYINTSDRKTNQPLAESHAKNYRVLSRMIARYSGYIRATDKSRENYLFDIDSITREDIEEFSDYLRHEKELAEDKPKLFEKIISEYPDGVVKGEFYNKDEAKTSFNIPIL